MLVHGSPASPACIPPAQERNDKQKNHEKKKKIGKETGVSQPCEHILGPAQEVLDETADFRGAAHLHKHTPLLQSTSPGQAVLVGEKREGAILACKHNS